MGGRHWAWITLLFLGDSSALAGGVYPAISCEELNTSIHAVLEHHVTQPEMTPNLAARATLRLLVDEPSSTPDPTSRGFAQAWLVEYYLQAALDAPTCAKIDAAGALLHPTAFGEPARNRFYAHAIHALAQTLDPFSKFEPALKLDLPVPAHLVSRPSPPDSLPLDPLAPPVSTTPSGQGIATANQPTATATAPSGDTPIERHWTDAPYSRLSWIVTPELGRVAVIRFDSFENGKTIPRLREMLTLAQGFRPAAVVLDLRSNVGGSVDEMSGVAGLFFEKVITYREWRPPGTVVAYVNSDPAILYGGPLVVWTSRATISSGETLTAALKDYRRAWVVGAVSTFGKTLIQHTFEGKLGNLKVSISQVIRPSGESHHLTGITSHIVLQSLESDQPRSDLLSALPIARLHEDPLLTPPEDSGEGRSWQPVTGEQVRAALHELGMGVGMPLPKSDQQTELQQALAAILKVSGQRP